MHKYNCVDTLCNAGIAHADAIALRRISMTLHRWHELECGNGDNYKNYCLVRGHYKRPSPDKPREFIYADDGRPYLETHFHDRPTPVYLAQGDRENGALNRLRLIMARYPGFTPYVQGDPRGCALYIMRPGDMRDGASLDSYYSNGIAVCK